MVASCVWGSNVLISCHGGGRWLVVAPGGWAPLRATSTAILETSPEREPCGGFGGPHARERGVLSGELGPRARECGFLRTWWSSRRRLVDLVATMLRRWVLHVSGPFGVVLPALWLHFGTGAASVVFDDYL
jgi:hypothetical protein